MTPWMELRKVKVPCNLKEGKPDFELAGLLLADDIAITAETPDDSKGRLTLGACKWECANAE